MTNSIAQPDVFFDPKPDLMSVPWAAIGRLWSRTSQLKLTWDLVHAVGNWQHVKFMPDSSGLSISLGRITLGHLDWNGRLDLPLGPQARKRLVEEKMVVPDARYPGTECVMFLIRNDADVERAVWLLRLTHLIMESTASCGESCVKSLPVNQVTNCHSYDTYKHRSAQLYGRPANPIHGATANLYQSTGAFGGIMSWHGMCDRPIRIEEEDDMDLR